MALIVHIFLALGSIVYTAYTYFTPTLSRLRLSYASAALTLLSGFYLVLSTHSPILKSCVTGLTYLGIEMFGIVAVHRKLAHEYIKR